MYVITLTNSPSSNVSGEHKLGLRYKSKVCLWTQKGESTTRIVLICMKLQTKILMVAKSSYDQISSLIYRSIVTFSLIKKIFNLRFKVQNRNTFDLSIG